MTTLDTRSRILDTALASFALRGYEATSLDAVARELGVSKQTILYHFASKEALLGAVIDGAAHELGAALSGAADRPGHDGRDPFARVEAIVDAVFRLSARRPELLELLREITRLGPPASTRLIDALEPLLRRAGTYLTATPDPRRAILEACAMVIGMATEVEVLRRLGVEPDLASLRRRRRRLLAYLRQTLA